ncbi:benzoate 1,2-dioxygenase electron transfer component BenC [uncultured Psychrobacter sp.]|uniref:benzoate 1,2-dioxygenase electron transfer component BenC n=1 Tax=uncultured Psychrobacter sp. TaxID=259303 RepID=UPI003457F9E3
MEYNIALQFEDGVTGFIKCGDDETVAEAAYRQKYNIPVDCLDGACGTCRCHCESGSYDLHPDMYIEEALTEAEANEGYVLTCQMIPESDCVLKVPSSSEACKVGKSLFKGKLQQLNVLSESTIHFGVEVDDPDALVFLPGQYVNINIPDTKETRSYSFSSMPSAKQAEFVVRNIPNGKMSTFLSDIAQVGQDIDFEGPFGSFYLRPVVRPTLFLAGGTGIAPFLSMLKSLEVSGAHHPINMVYGVTNDADLIELEKLDEVKKNHSWFNYYTCVVSEDSAHERKGYVTGHVESDWLNGGEVDIYLCGPPAMVDAVSHWLDDSNLKPSNFYFEKFLPSEQ